MELLRNTTVKNQLATAETNLTPAQLLDKLSQQPDQMAFLDQSFSRDKDELRQISSLLNGMDPQDILSRFQPGVLVWMAANATMQEDLYRFRKGLESIGFDGDIFERARLWEWQRNGYSRFGGNILNQYQVLDSVHSGVLQDVNLVDILRNSSKDGMELSQSRLQDYDLAPLRLNRAQEDKRYSVSTVAGREKRWGQANESGEYYGIFIDTPSGFALTYKDKPQAVVAIAADGPDGIAIHQMQGVKGNKVDPERPYSNTNLGKISARGLVVLDWQKLMVGVTIDIAQQLNKKHVTIISGDKNMWTKPQFSDIEPHLTLPDAYAAYDMQAQRLGFTQRQDGNWQLPIAS